MFCEFRLAAEAVHNPGHPGAAHFVQAQQAVEGPHAVYYDGFPHPLGQCCLGTEGGRLQFDVGAAQCVEAAFAYCPHVGQGGVGLSLCHLLLPVAGHVPGVQAYGACRDVGPDLSGLAVEHVLLGGVGGQ